MIDPAWPDISKLPREVVQNLTRCEGFIELKMPDRAAKELDAIQPEFHDHMYVVWMKVAILQLRKAWKEALPLARSLRDDFPKEAGFWIQLAYITRRAENIQAAREILLEANTHFPKNETIIYNLACYACQLEELEEARTFLHIAIKMDRDWLKTALEDDDLEALHDELEDEP